MMDDPRPLHESKTDDALLREVAAGDETALRILYERHVRWLALRLRRRLSVEATEDVLQETFFAVWTSAGRYAGSGDVAAWIWGIARRQAALWARRHGRDDLAPVFLTAAGGATEVAGGELGCAASRGTDAGGSTVTVAVDWPMVGAFPRLLTLFLRQRAVVGSLAVLVAIDAGLVVLTGWVEEPGQESRLGYLLLLAPCVVPAVIGTAMWSRGADMETHVPFPLRWPRLVHLAMLVAVGIGGSSIVVGSWLGRVEDLHQGSYWLRYSLVVLAMTLIGVRTIGPRLAWVTPMLLVIVVYFARSRVELDGPLGYPWWLWVLRRTDDAMSWWLKITAGVLAIALFLRWGPRPDNPGEG